MSYRALLGIELPLIEELVILYFSEMELLAHKEISPLIEYEGQRDFEGEKARLHKEEFSCSGSCPGCSGCK